LAQFQVFPTQEGARQTEPSITGLQVDTSPDASQTWQAFVTLGCPSP
jgi:hypothetical protein